MPFRLRSLFAFILPILAACSSTPSPSSTGSPAGSGGSSGSSGSGQACSGGSDAGAQGGSEPHTSADLTGACQNLFDQRTAYSNACIGNPGLGPDAAAFVTLCLGVATAPGSLVTVADVDACANEVGALKCLGQNQYPSCTGGTALLFPEGDKKGASPAGAPCFAGVQCASGHCDVFSGPCGQCMRGRALGETCSTAGDVCLDSACGNGKCVTPGTALGTKCFQYGGSSNCQAGLVCNPLDGTEGDGFCAPLGTTGDTCKATFQCAQGLYCDDGRCSPLLANGACCDSMKEPCASECVDGMCRQRKIGQNEGESCLHDDCEEGLICDGAVCTSQGLLAKGDNCWSGAAFTGSCGAGLVCDNFCGTQFCPSGACIEAPAIGAACAGFGECGPGAGCVGFSTSPASKGVCTKLGNDGEACPCASDRVCSNGKCVTFGPAVCQ